MSSFYGQMRWQDFKRFFYYLLVTSFKFKDDDVFNEDPKKASERTLLEGDMLHIQPNEDFSRLSINSANHWIKFAPWDSVGDDLTTYKGFSIFHNSPSLNNLSEANLLTIGPVPEGEPVITLKSGDTFHTTQLKFDQAGHYCELESLTPIYFQLPPQIISVNQHYDLTLGSNQKFNFLALDGLINLTVSNNNTVLNFTHTTYFNQDTTQLHPFYFAGPKDGTNYTVKKVLEPGDYISTYEITYDKAGHAKTLTKVYYQLPISELDQRLENLQEAINEINSNMEILETNVNNNTNTIEEHSSAIADMLTLLADDKEELNDAISGLASSLNISSLNTTYSIPEGIVIIYRYLIDYLNGYILRGFHARISNIENFLERKYPDEFEIPSN